jgi:hypothetical protein
MLLANLCFNPASESKSWGGADNNLSSDWAEDLQS